MGAYLATPPLPWANNVGGTIILRDKYVTLQDIIDGAVVFQVQDNHGIVSNASVVQYPSDQKYYLQASGSMLWQLGDISQAVNRIELIATGNIPQGYSLVEVKVQSVIAYAVELYADENGTQRPINGQKYSTLYAKLNKQYGFGDTINYGGDTGVKISTPETEYPDDPYWISFDVDYSSQEYNDDLNKGIYELIWQRGAPDPEDPPEFEFNVSYGPPIYG